MAALNFGAFLDGALGCRLRPYTLLSRRRLGRSVVDQEHKGSGAVMTMASLPTP